jgi:hypothetical protein
MAIDFTHLKQQLSIARILDHLGLSARLKGTGTQRRCLARSTEVMREAGRSA